MKILIFHENGFKRYFIIPELNEQLVLTGIFHRVFKEREDDGIYNVQEMRQRHRKLYDEAQKGNIVPFMKFRSSIGAEYETFEIVEAEEHTL